MNLNRCEPVSMQTERQVKVAAYFGAMNAAGLTADFSDRRGIKSKFVTLDFQATGPKAYVLRKDIYLDVDLELQGARIMAIELLGTAQMTVVPLSPVKDPPVASYANGLLTLVDDCNKKLLTTPLANLCRSLNGNKLTFTDLQHVDLSRSYVSFIAASGISEANALPFVFYFNP